MIGREACGRCSVVFLLFGLAWGQRPLAWQTISTLDGVPLRDAGKPDAARPYLGLVLQDKRSASGEAQCLVYVVRPGPVREALGLRGSDYPTLLLQSMNEREIHSSAEFRRAMETVAAGSEARLRFVQTSPGPEKVRAVTVRVAAWEDWAAPIDFARPPERRIAPEAIVQAGQAPTRFENYIEEQLDAHGIRAAVDETRKHLVRAMEANYAPNMLSRVAYGFYRPARLAELGTTITDPLERIVDQRKTDPMDVAGAVLQEAAKNLDTRYAPPERRRIDMTDPGKALREAAGLIGAAHTHLEAAFAKLDAADRNRLTAAGTALLDPARWQELPVIRARRAAAAIDQESLLAAAGAVLAWSAEKPAAREAMQGVELPAALQGAAKGDVLAAERIDGRWFVYGGGGSNEYDMSRIDVVIDAGGDDTYLYRQAQPLRVQLIVDWSGDDRYRGADGVGPAGGLLGVSIVVDRDGSDRYEGGELSCGAGLMGVGLIVDSGGADIYRGTRWTQGAAKFGFGGIVDLGAGPDVYIAQEFSQGAGGPRGFGLLLDEGGNDLYRASEPAPAAGRWRWGSQGFGSGDFALGVGAYDVGGIGVLCDLAGDDRYEVGEFGQGAGLFYGLGVLHDRRGRDLYSGWYYSQGAAAHGGTGILIDDAGDDTHWGSIGRAHDASLALVLDRGGDDSYQGEYLGVGLNQGIGWLIDLDGKDRYNIPAAKPVPVSESSDGKTNAAAVYPLMGMGESSGNEFSYGDCRCFAFSLLLDAGGSADVYSGRDRGDGMTILTGRANPRMPQDGNLHGLFIDTKEKADFWPQQRR